MSDQAPIQFNTEGKPLRINDLDIAALAIWLNKKKVRTSQGKLYQPLHSGHIEIVNDPARYKVLACGRRYGKSLIVSLMALAALMQINRRVWICAPDYSLGEKVFRELYNILVVQLKLIVPGRQGQARQQKGDYYLKTPWGSVLEVKSLESPDSLAGEANDLVIVDEAALHPNIEDIFTQMLQPTLLDKEGSAVFISTPRGKNQFYKLFLYGQTGLKQKQGKTQIAIDEETGISNDLTHWSSFQKSTYDNPHLASTPEKAKEEIDAAYRQAALSGKTLKFKQEYLADFNAISDSVFPNFIVESTNKIPHVVNYTYHPDEGPVFASCDFNFAKPASTIFAQVNKYGDVVIFDEKFTPHTTTYMQAQQILEKERELSSQAQRIWKQEGHALEKRYHIKFNNIIGDIAGDQVQLNGRTAWDDMESVLGRGRRPVGLKQARETGGNMIRLWLDFPQFDSKGKVLVDEFGEQKTAPKLYITSNCVNLIYAVSTATFKKAKNGILKEDYDETPEGYEGLLDALRYLMVYLFHNKGDYTAVLQGVN